MFIKVELFYYNKNTDSHTHTKPKLVHPETYDFADVYPTMVGLTEVLN